MTEYFIRYTRNRTIYPQDSQVTKYPGSGQVRRAVGATLFVAPKGVGRPIFAPTDQRSKYAEAFYDVVEMSAQEQLLYTVARFLHWENIAGSSDKYMVVKNPKTQENEKYRVGVEQSELFGSDELGKTNVFIEDVSAREETTQNPVTDVSKLGIENLDFAMMRDMIKRGESVIILPLFAPPAWEKRDGEGYYIASQIIIRRAGGEINE